MSIIAEVRLEIATEASPPTMLTLGPPALVMLHGAPCDSRAWQWMLPDLSRDHTVVAWDAPGFGQSSDIDDHWRAAQFADALYLLGQTYRKVGRTEEALQTLERFKEVSKVRVRR